MHSSQKQMSFLWKFIQTDIRDTDSYSDSYSTSLPIASYYLTMIQIKNFYLHSKTYNMGLKQNLYLASLSRRGPVNPSTPTFPIIHLTETIANLIVA